MLLKINKSVISKKTLNALETESSYLEPYSENIIHLPSISAELFLLVYKWLDQRVLEIVDPETYNPECHISTWCRLHVLATRFFLEDLAAECLAQYRECRQPLWQGGWIPLPAEIDYAYDTTHADRHVAALKAFLAGYVVSQLASCEKPVDFRELAELAGRNQMFMVDVLRATRCHLFEPEYAPNGCMVEDCRIHPRWPDPEDGFIHVSPFRVKQSGSSNEVHAMFVTDEEEEALAETEVEEAIREADEVKEQLYRENAV